MTRGALAAVVLAAALGAAPADAAESWNSACLMPLRQAKEDWTRLSTSQARNAVAREIKLAERSYRRGLDKECAQRVERIVGMMK